MGTGLRVRKLSYGGYELNQFYYEAPGVRTENHLFDIMLVFSLTTFFASLLVAFLIIGMVFRHEYSS